MAFWETSNFKVNRAAKGNTELSREKQKKISTHELNLRPTSAKCQEKHWRCFIFPVSDVIICFISKQHASFQTWGRSVDCVGLFCNNLRSQSLSWIQIHQSQTWGFLSNGDNFGQKSSSYTKCGDEVTKLQRSRRESTPEGSPRERPPAHLSELKQWKEGNEIPAQRFERLITLHTKQKKTTNRFRHKPRPLLESAENCRIWIKSRSLSSCLWGGGGGFSCSPSPWKCMWDVCTRECEAFLTCSFSFSFCRTRLFLFFPHSSFSSQVFLFFVALK